jgi:uncharacterized membrane protein
MTELSVKSLPLLVAASAGFVIFGCLLVWMVIRLLRSNRKQLIATGPMIARQEFLLRESGPLMLLVEVPRLGSNFRNLEFELVEKATGQSTTMHYDFLRAQGAVYGVRTMRVPIGRFVAQKEGSYLLRITGLQPDADYSESRIMFSHPYLARMIVQIIGIVFFAIGMLLTLILALWQILPLQHG